MTQKSSLIIFKSSLETQVIIQFRNKVVFYPGEDETVSLVFMSGRCVLGPNENGFT